MHGTQRAPRSTMETNDMILNEENYAIDGATLDNCTLECNRCRGEDPSDEDSINVSDDLEMTDDDKASPLFPKFGVSFPNCRPNSSCYKLCDAQLDNDEKRIFSNQPLDQYCQTNQRLVSQQNRILYQWKEDQHFMPQSTTFQHMQWPGTALPKLSKSHRPDQEECVDTSSALNFIARPNFGTAKFATYNNFSLESNTNTVTCTRSILPNDSILQECIYKREEIREKLLLQDETYYNVCQATTSSMEKEIHQEEANFRQRINSLQMKQNIVKEKLIENQRQRSGAREKLRYMRAHSVPMPFGSRGSRQQRRLSLPQTLQQGCLAGSQFPDQEYDTIDSECKKPSHMKSFDNLCFLHELQEIMPLATINNLTSERKDTEGEQQYYSMLPGPNICHTEFNTNVEDSDMQSFGDESSPHKISVLAPATFSTSHERASTDTISNMKYLPLPDTELSEIGELKKKVSKVRISKTFPAALMQEFQNQANEDAIAWLPDGLSFVIVSKERFLKDILPTAGLSQPKLSNNSDMKYESFVRKLHRWGFTRLAAGTGVDCFYHPKFVRDCPMLVNSIEPARKVGKVPLLSPQNQDDEKFNGNRRPSLAGIDNFTVQRTSDDTHGITGGNKISAEDGSES